MQESLIELMKTKHILQISVKDICDTAGTARSTFYSYYKDQFDLLRQTGDEIIRYFEDSWEKNKNTVAKHDVEEAYEEALRFIVENKNPIQILLSENGDPSSQKRFFKRYIKRMVTPPGFTDKEGNGIDQAAYYSVFAANGALAFVQQWLKNNMDIPIPEAAKLLSRLMHYT
jgi:AcrR family transcriptional regulator